MSAMANVLGRAVTETRTIRRLRLLLAAVAACVCAASLPARAQDEGTTFVPKLPERQSWSFAGPFGIYDTAQLQRGYKIYREICSNCHSMENMRFRNLADPGGPDFTEGQVEALAAEFKVTDGPDDNGKMFKRPGRPADAFPKPFPNVQMAKLANGGGVPPDMSVLAKARSYEPFDWFPADVAYSIWSMLTQYQTQGPDYISALLQGYQQPPPGFKIEPGQNYNEVFAAGNGIIAMPPPLQDGVVQYPKGPDGKPVVPETVQQYSRDVAAFLMWVAEPKLDERKRIGLEVMIFLIVAAGLMYFVKKKVWADVHA
jgi:cytochrome c1